MGERRHDRRRRRTRGRGPRVRLLTTPPRTAQGPGLGVRTPGRPPSGRSGWPRAPARRAGCDDRRRAAVRRPDSGDDLHAKDGAAARVVPRAVRRRLAGLRGGPARGRDRRRRGRGRPLVRRRAAGRGSLTDRPVFRQSAVRGRCALGRCRGALRTPADACPPHDEPGCGAAAGGRRHRTRAARCTGTGRSRCLGDRLDEAAALNGWTPAQLRACSRSDPTAWVDRDGAGLLRRAGPGRVRGRRPSRGRSVLTRSARHFTLHSRPGSSHTIFLDFDGATVSGTAWNDQGVATTARSPRGRLDGDATTFSDTERTRSPGRLAARRRGLRTLRRRRHHRGPGRRRRSTAALRRHRVRHPGTDLPQHRGAPTRSARRLRRRRLHRRLRQPGSSHSYYQPAWVFPQKLGQRHQEHRRGGQPRGRPQLRAPATTARVDAVQPTATTAATPSGRRSWASATEAGRAVEQG